jgi:hypothetical protein
MDFVNKDAREGRERDRGFLMACIYLLLGIFLGGLSAFLIMAMFFVAKKADDHEAARIQL